MRSLASTCIELRRLAYPRKPPVASCYNISWRISVQEPGILPRKLDLGSRIQILGELDLGAWIKDSKSWIQDPASSVLDPRPMQHHTLFPTTFKHDCLMQTPSGVDLNDGTWLSKASVSDCQALVCSQRTNSPLEIQRCCPCHRRHCVHTSRSCFFVPRGMT